MLPPRRPTQTRTAIIAYLSFLAIGLFPTILQMLVSPADRVWASGPLAIFLLWLVAPAVQMMGIVAKYAQARETRSRGSAGALSVRGLVVQAVVFLLVGISFVYRLPMPDPPDDYERHFVVDLREWYWLMGRATINNVIFGLAQGRVAWIASHQKDGNDEGESDPLLA